MTSHPVYSCRPDRYEDWCKFGDSRSNRSRDTRLSHFVANDDDDNDAGVRRSSQKRLQKRTYWQHLAGRNNEGAQIIEVQLRRQNARRRSLLSTVTKRCKVDAKSCYLRVLVRRCYCVVGLFRTLRLFVCLSSAALYIVVKRCKISL